MTTQRMNRKQRRQASKQVKPTKLITEAMLEELFEDFEDKFPIQTYTTPSGVEMVLVNGYWLRADTFDQALNEETP